MLLSACPNVPPEQEKIMELVDVATGRQHQPRVDDLVAGVCEMPLLSAALIRTCFVSALP